MSSTLLEVTRGAHEEVERLERLIVKDLQNEATSSKERLAQSHRVRHMIDTVSSTTERLIEIYEDNDNARKDEIAALGGQTATGTNVFSAFYDRLKEIREYHRRHPAALVVDANEEHEALLKEEPQVEFSGEKLGFASCKRNSGATEGINVLMEKKNLDGRWAYGLSCIEYTEFDKFGLADGPHSCNSLQAEFPANTNILYVDLPSAELVGSSKNTNSLPGMVLNVKKPIAFVDHFGKPHSVSGGRLECTMQNIADNFLNACPSRDCKGVEDKLDTFIVFNKRRRVTSSAKKKRRHADKSLHQTPDGSLLDILRNAHDLLSQCDINLPEIESNDKYLNSGPPFLILLHPALGPLWEVTRQKFYGGSICKGSELQVEVAEFLWRNVQLDGSLIIEADNVMGSSRVDQNGEPVLQYGRRCGRCKLQNVKVLNEGIDWNFGDNVYWKHVVQRIEACKVVLHGNAEFEATDVILKGNHIFEVPNGYKMKIAPGNSGLAIGLDPIKENMMDSGSWYWKYGIKGTHIQLELVEL